MSQLVVGSDYSTSQLVAAANASTTTLLTSVPTEPYPTLGAGEYFYGTIIDQPSYVIDANPPAQRGIVKVTAWSIVSSGIQVTCVRAITTAAQIWALGSIFEIRPCEQWFEDLKGGGGGSSWAITDGIVTVTDVTNMFVTGTGTSTVTLADLGTGSVSMTVDSTGGGGSTPTVNAQTGTTYTLVSGDNGNIVTLSNASAITLTVPSGLGANYYTKIIQLGAGQVTVTASGTTIHAYGSFSKLAGQYASGMLYAYVANTFLLEGNISG